MINNFKETLSKNIKIEIFLNVTFINIIFAIIAIVPFLVEIFVDFSDDIKKLAIIAAIFWGIIILVNFISIPYRIRIYSYKIKKTT